MNKLEEQQNFLLRALKTAYNQADSYFANFHKFKWSFGHKNDYPMQHGDGGQMKLPDEFVSALIYNDKPVR